MFMKLRTVPCVVQSVCSNSNAFRKEQSLCDRQFVFWSMINTRFSHEINAIVFGMSLKLTAHFLCHLKRGPRAFCLGHKIHWHVLNIFFGVCTWAWQWLCYCLCLQKCWTPFQIYPSIGMKHENNTTQHNTAQQSRAHTKNTPWECSLKFIYQFASLNQRAQLASNELVSPTQCVCVCSKFAFRKMNEYVIYVNCYVQHTISEGCLYLCTIWKIEI